MSTAYYVYTATHPNDVSEHRDIYSAHAAMAALVELGHAPTCEREGLCGSVSILGWGAVCAAVNGEG